MDKFCYNTPLMLIRKARPEDFPAIRKLAALLGLDFAGMEQAPFWLAEEEGFAPAWNFNKVLIGPEGEVVATWGSTVGPNSSRITREIEALLP